MSEEEELLDEKEAIRLLNEALDFSTGRRWATCASGSCSASSSSRSATGSGSTRRRSSATPGCWSRRSSRSAGADHGGRRAEVDRRSRRGRRVADRDRGEGRRRAAGGDRADRARGSLGGARAHARAPDHAQAEPGRLPAAGAPERPEDQHEARRRIGCSGWNYKDWRGVVYPEGLPQRRWLERYAEIFDTVEINTTFYGTPKPKSVANWVEQTPDGFLFTVKASRYLTHIKRLADSPAKNFKLTEGIERFYEPLAPLREAGKLGPVLWQLPGNFRRDDERLAHALSLLPPRAGTASSSATRAGSPRPSTGCSASTMPRSSSPTTPSGPSRPAEVTASWTFLRLHRGSRGRRGNYSDAELATWRRRIAAWRARVEVFAYLNNDWEAFAPRNALTLAGREPAFAEQLRADPGGRPAHYDRRLARRIIDMGTNSTRLLVGRRRGRRRRAGPPRIAGHRPRPRGRDLRPARHRRDRPRLDAVGDYLATAEGLGADRDVGLRDQRRPRRQQRRRLPGRAARALLARRAKRDRRPRGGAPHLPRRAQRPAAATARPSSSTSAAARPS